MSERLSKKLLYEVLQQFRADQILPRTALEQVAFDIEKSLVAPTKKKEQVMPTKEEKKLLDTLADLGGESFQEKDITFQGSKLILPTRMTAKRAITTLQAYMKQEETITRFHREYRYRPFDGAAAFERAIRKLTGMSGIAKGQVSFFGTSPPDRVSIPIGVDETMDVPWGGVNVEMFASEQAPDGGYFYVGATGHPEYGSIFYLTVDCARKHRAAIEGLFKMIQDELEENSIYRGKVFDGQERPDFVDLSGLKPEEIVFAEDVSEHLSTHLWSPIRDTPVHRQLGMPLKRAVLLHGVYGTGKTLAAFLTARIAEQHGWTFVYCRPGKDNLHEVMQTARLYQPAVVFFEDVDTVSGEDESRDAVSTLLDVFDGIKAKGTELLAVLTTNHPEKIHKGMLRPGRLDAIISIGALDSTGIERLIRAVVGDRVDDLEMGPIANAMTDFVPAFVREAIDRASRHAIARTGEAPDKLETVDFVNAAMSLRDQYEMMEGAHELREADKLQVALANAARQGVEGLIVQNQDWEGEIIDVNHQ